MTTAATTPGTSGARTVRAPRGTQMTCKTWQAEAALRMLMNNLDPEVAENPDELIVYGGRGQAARSWAAFDAIVATLKNLEADETLLVQSGKPVGVCRTTPDAPRVLIANSNLVPTGRRRSTSTTSRAKGLIMFGQMTAGSWIYIGTQGILQGTYETFAECARQHFGGTLKGRLCVTAGCGGMGGAQPLAVTMNEGVCLLAEVCKVERLEKRVRDRYLDEIDRRPRRRDRRGADRPPRPAKSVDRLARQRRGSARAELVERDITPDALTDQTSAHDPLNGYYPQGMTREQADELRVADPDHLRRAERWTRWPATSRLMLELQKRGREDLRLRQQHPAARLDNGFENAFGFPGFVPAYIRPQFCRAAGRSGGWRCPAIPKDIAATDDAILELFPDDEHLRAAGSSLARRARRVPGAAGAHLLAGARRAGQGRPASSTSWSATAWSRRRSSSGATISTAARWRHPTARPRR